jgi:DNA polymerase-3 subunit alpha
MNESDTDFSVVNVNQPSGNGPAKKVIRFGLGAVKGVGEGAVDVIKIAREQGGAFLTLFDFCKRVDGRKVNRKVIEALVKAGAFDGIAADNKITRARMFGAIGVASERAAEAQRERESGQTNLLALFAGPSGKPGPGLLGEDRYPDAEEWMPKELLAYEKESLGFYISGHPLDRYLGEIRRFTSASCANCMEKGERNEVVLAGVINAFSERPLKSGMGKIAFFNLEDQTGQVEFFVSSKKLEEYREILSHDEPMLITGVVEAPWGGNDGDAAPRERLKFVDAKLLSKVRSEKSSLLDIRLNADLVREEQLPALDKLLRSHQGPCRVVLRMEIPKRSETVMDLGDDYKVAASDELLARIEQIFGARVAVLR